MKLFIPFLSITLFAELFANHTYYVSHLPTGWIYNILNPITQTFYTYIFYKISITKAHKILMFAVNSCYIASYIIFYSFYSDINDFNNYLVTIGGIQQVIFSCLFFYECLQTDVITDYRMKSGLWIAAGLLIFYSGITICMALLNFIEENHLTIAGVPLYNIIPRTLSIILYSCLSISFITWRKSIQIKQ
jgi:hypothetical protein